MTGLDGLLCFAAAYFGGVIFIMWCLGGFDFESYK